MSHSSKSQYERHLKIWGYQKNLKKDDWSMIAQVCRKRKELGKDSIVEIDHRVISSKRLRKEISRYGLNNTRQEFVQGLYPCYGPLLGAKFLSRPESQHTQSTHLSSSDSIAKVFHQHTGKITLTSSALRVGLQPEEQRRHARLDH